MAWHLFFFVLAWDLLIGLDLTEFFFPWVGLVFFVAFEILSLVGLGLIVL